MSKPIWFVLIYMIIYIISSNVAEILQDEPVERTTASNNPNTLSIDIQTFKWSKITEEKITNVSGLLNYLVNDLLDILPGLLTKNKKTSRFKRNKFVKQKLCDISEDEVNSLKVFLTSINQQNSQVGNVIVPTSFHTCNRLIVDIKNLIIKLKNNYLSLYSLQITPEVFKSLKHSYEGKLLELQRKFDNLRDSSTEELKTKINKFLETIESLKIQSHVLMINLENERNDHRNTKIRLCIAEIKNNKDFPECIVLLKNEYNNASLITKIVSSAYETNVERISPLIELCNKMEKFLTKIIIYEALLSEMENNGHTNSPMILQIHFDIDGLINHANYRSLNVHIKLRYETAKKVAYSFFNSGINIFASEIRSERYESVNKFEMSHLNAFDVVSETLTQTTYSNNLEFAGKFISFLNLSRRENCLTKMIKLLFNLMESNNHISTSQGMLLAGRVRSFIDSDNFSSYSDETKQMFLKLKHRFPCGIYRLFWINEHSIKSLLHSEYFYTASLQHKFDESKRNVYTWQSGRKFIESEWQFETKDFKYFKIFNTYYKEYLFAVDDQRVYDAKRRFVVTTSDTRSMNDQFYWEIIPRDSNTFYIKNKQFNEYLYSSAYTADEFRRKVFTWRPKSVDGLWNIGDCGDVLNTLRHLMKMVSDIQEKVHNIK